MTQTLPEPMVGEVDPFPTTSLEELEEETRAGVESAVAGAVAAFGLGALAVASAADQVAQTVEEALHRAMVTGAALGRVTEPVIGRRQSLGGTGVVLPPLRAVVSTVLDGEIARELREWLGRAGQALQATSVGSRSLRLERIVRGLWAWVLTRIHRAVNAGAVWAASSAGVGLLWYVRVDERTCRRCMQMQGRVVASANLRFAWPDSGLGAVWAGFDGLPPLHPRCRCFARPYVV
ncbi:hypothetical protein BJF83_21490 [Nocardiopsis sp. CNR-923]|uniref:hypothetical protein n=1 Tax=Nocardiopsis sp. CNR-923 TaxID=1904965 RepID=UPI00095CDAD8|nr:hypothetical protein [Nocardiopsis sp. CNR-923]OLT26377.1 hypothetical protein BJF83_21490 [Nocardiopsis sp. CNR-923]